MIAKKYIPPIKYLGSAIIILLILGGIVLPVWSDALLLRSLQDYDPDAIQSLQDSAPDDSIPFIARQDKVMVSSIPFVTRFVALILGYILFMFIFALRFNHVIPYRTYRAIEILIIAGIVVGIGSLLQPEQLTAYRYSFLWLLGSTLLFIMWSHVIPKSAEESSQLAPFKISHQIVGVIAAGIVIALVLAYFLSIARPEAPYGYTERQWNRGLRDEQKQTIIQEADDTFNNFTAPYLVFMSLFPAALAFLSTREIAAAVESRVRSGSSIPSPVSPKHSGVEP